jgi:micrococcal nuclease
MEVIVPVPVRRLTFGLLLAGAMLAGVASPAPVAAQTSCDPSYPDFCIAPAWEVGDLDCYQVAGAWFTVIPPDPHGFDADYDGYGCESN